MHKDILEEKENQEERISFGIENCNFIFIFKTVVQRIREMVFPLGIVCVV
jgi:hypothetical protein